MDFLLVPLKQDVVVNKLLPQTTICVQVNSAFCAVWDGNTGEQHAIQSIVALLSVGYTCTSSADYSCFSRDRSLSLPFTIVSFL